jgi:ribosomal protein S18 acetylase RimI-like enzyme
MLQYAIEHRWDERSSEIVMEGLIGFNKAYIGVDTPKKMSIIVRNEEGDIVAGLLGETKWDWMYISWVWVNDDYRSQRIGTRLMRDAEREARQMGCHHAHLTTLDFQAKAFYEKLGYAVFATLDDFPLGHTRFMMKKGLASTPEF